MLDASTQVHSFADPDSPSISKIGLDGTDKMNMADVNIQNKLVHILNSHGAATV